MLRNNYYGRTGRYFQDLPSASLSWLAIGSFLMRTPDAEKIALA
ncbi:MAG: hypothetical protein ACI8ZT_000396, partial [Bacteroidia bacterium]